MLGGRFIAAFISPPRPHSCAVIFIVLVSGRGARHQKRQDAPEIATKETPARCDRFPVVFRSGEQLDVARTGCPEQMPRSIIRRPTTKPTSADVTVMPLMPVAEERDSDAAVAAETSFGIRRWRRSISAPARHRRPEPRANNVRCGPNRRPVELIHMTTEQCHRSHGEQRDERDQQPVLEEILDHLQFVSTGAAHTY